MFGLNQSKGGSKLILMELRKVIQVFKVQEVLHAMKMVKFHLKVPSVCKMEQTIKRKRKQLYL